MAALAMMGLTRFASAEPITTNTAGWTVDNFEDSCLKAGGEAITIEDGNGNAVESSCGFSDGSVNTCNWSTDTCVFSVYPTPNGPLGDTAVDPNDLGGVQLPEDTPTPTPSGPVLTGNTPVPTTTAEPTEAMPSAVIAVAKYACPDSIGYGESGFDVYINACTDPMPDVSFKLDGASTGNPGEQLTDANGQVTWIEMEGDHYYLTEQVPAGYGTPVAFCIVTGASDYQGYAVSGENRIEFDVADGQTITCYWFNISPNQTGAAAGATPLSGTAPSAAAPSPTPPASTIAPDEAATLVIHAYRCEPGYDDRAGEADPATDCVERPTDDITFGLVGTGDSSGEPRRRVKFNGQPGEFVITDLAPGTYQLIEVEFEPDQTAFILGCTSTQRAFDGYPFDPFAVVSAAGSVRLSLVVGETLTCDWYDVPPPNPALSLQVYACGTASPSEENCEPATGQFQFVLAPVDGAGEAISFTTDADGSVELTNVEGSSQLLEIGPQPCGMTATGTGADGNLALSAEQEVVVQIFHCE